MRDIAEIESDLKAVEGVKGQGNKIGKLRKELIAAQREKLADLENAVEMGIGPITVGQPGWSAAMPVATASDDDDEWKFIEASCAEIRVPQTGYSSVGLVKMIYNDLAARIVAWRISRRVSRNVGPGADWPQFGALGIKNTDGKPEHEHSIFSDDWIPGWTPPKEPDSRESEPPASQVEPEYTVPTNAVPPGQPMPGALGGSATDAVDEAEKIRAMMANQIDAKGEPELETAKGG